MPRLSIWNSGKKSNDYKYFDHVISEFFGVSGTAVYVHKYLGPHDQSEDGAAELDETSIQDVLFLENRDRRYADEVYELRGVYNVQDNDFDLRQFGLFLTGDTLFIEFHLNDMINMIGRKIMSGDVIELPHQRDDALLDPEAKAINKFYVVEDATRSSSGYSSTWWPHIWRIKVSPMHSAQEYQDILDKQAQNPLGFDNGRIGDLMSMVAKEMEINEAVVEDAKANVSKRNFETQHFWVLPGTETGDQNPWIFAGDGVPPNGAEPLGAGNRFPEQKQEGDYYLRTDYEPHTLFRYVSNAWRIQELDYRKSGWSAAHRILENFINNDRETQFRADNIREPSKTSLHKAVKPRADF